MNAIPHITYPKHTVDPNGLTRDDRQWLDKFLTEHTPMRGLLNAGYMQVLKARGKFEANQLLVSFRERLRRRDLWLSMDDARLRDWCEAKARHCRLTVNRFDEKPLRAQKHISEMLNSYGIDFPLQVSRSVELACFDPFEVAYAKLSDAGWWRRQVRTLQKREQEEYARLSGVVHSRGQIYCSDHNVRARADQKKRNRMLLSELEATNELGESFTLEELADLSVSNPKIRRAELMVRIAGFEEYAERLGYVAEFYTITCPSRFHRKTIIRDKHGNVQGVKDNEKFDGSSVRDAHDYIVGVGSRIRSALARHGIDIFGFRVAEPHHDGCPHWHYLVFTDEHCIRDCRNIFKNYALADSPLESGARRHRFKAEAIDKSRGTAAGYIAKYISKNIDGHGVEADLYGHDAEVSANRIDAWASVHRIRQFQQIGGPSVTVWRELRRLDEQEPGTLETARIAADTSNWADYCELMGSGRAQPIRPCYWQELDTATGEVSPVTNKYGEPVVGRLFGLLWGELEAVCTRFYSWTIDRVRSAFKPNLTDSISRVKSGTRMLFGVPVPVGVCGANAPPWSSVNNCTRVT